MPSDFKMANFSTPLKWAILKFFHWFGSRDIMISFKMAHFRRQKQMAHFEIGMHIFACGGHIVAYFCQSPLWPFWSPLVNRFYFSLYFVYFRSIFAFGNFNFQKNFKILDRARKQIHKKASKDKKKKRRRRIAEDDDSSGSDFNPFSWVQKKIY